jgi:exodeoxyribonuclease V alpha subunit
MQLPKPNDGVDTTLEGTLERIVYHNDDNGWSVLIVAVSRRREPVTVVGNMVGLQPGENVRFTGRWIEDRKWGEQFQATAFKVVLPGTVEGVERYLGSGLIPGIGPKMAKRLVKHFGIATLEVIDQHPERLKRVPGIGRKRLQQILASWEEQREVQRVMVFLQSHGVSTNFAIRIYKTYGADAIDVVRQNPYQLAQDVFGIGFQSADRIAEQLGIPKDSPRRLEAGTVYLLRQASEQGHLFLPRHRLVAEAAELLEVPPEGVETAVTTLETGKAVVCEPYREGAVAVYPTPLHNAEVGLAAALKALLESPSKLPTVAVPRALKWFEQREGIQLADQQRRAIAEALTSPVLVITGGPGTGKTTLLRGIVDILGAKDVEIRLAAPTGRAARRLGDATGRGASTVHRLLEMDPSQGCFLRDADRPLECDLLIVDEASMLDVPLAWATVRALPAGGRLILVGDVDQLPSVGPGRVLADLIKSAVVPVVRLTEIFRQAAESGIVTNAYRINAGEMPVLELPTGEAREKADFFWIERQDPEAVVDILLRLTTERIPRSFGLDPIADVQILTPMNRGPLGVMRLNTVLQERLNPGGEGLRRGGYTFRAKDKVMQIRNNYELEVFNGDVGVIDVIDEEEGEIRVLFEGRPRTYSLKDLDELVLAYACSIHKSQGSEYPAIIVPVHNQHYRMLQRNLFYTALTRAKKLAVLVGQRQALATAVRNQDTRKRFTRLAERLAGGSGTGPQ